MKAQHLRELLAMAKRLRASADQTLDRKYIELFLRAANDLENRASELAYGPPDQPNLKMRAALYAPVNLLC
jgi:hypothetical protein